ncbi:MAG: hypothetical protein ACXVRS_12245 [Gaiellaceae bacterium]
MTATDPWSEDEGRRARNQWRQTHGRPLQPIHDYRNRLVHGRVVPEVIANVTPSGEQVFIFPRIDRVDAYLDWRHVLDDLVATLDRGDFQDARSIAADAWDQVVAYCEDAWSTHLLPAYTPPTFSPPPEDDEPPPSSAGSASVYRP